MTAGELTMPALTAVSPKTSAPTILIAIPTALGIRMPVSLIISNNRITNSISVVARKGIPLSAVITVSINFRGIMFK